jgi:hypothetical protein
MAKRSGGRTTSGPALLFAAIHPMQFFASLHLRVRKLFNEAWAVFPMPFSASSASLVESEPVEDCGEPAFRARTYRHPHPKRVRTPA